MPARGDHERRRRQVALLAADLVATEGLAAVTHRRIAQAAGCSTTVVSHYFTDKRDLVTAIYREVGNRVAARLQAASSSDDRLAATLEALLPLDQDRTRDWRLLFTFLGLAATDAELTAEQRARAAAAGAQIETALAAEQQAGRILPDTDATALAQSLLSLVLGIGMQALFDPEQWPAERIRSAIADALQRVRPPHPSTGPLAEMAPSHGFPA